MSKIIGKVISFYKKANSSEVNTYTSGTTGKTYRMAVVAIEGLSSPVQVRAYSDDITIGSSVQIQQLVNQETGEIVTATDGTKLYSCLLNTTTDNSALDALFNVPAKVESVALVDDAVPTGKK